MKLYKKRKAIFDFIKKHSNEDINLPNFILTKEEINKFAHLSKIEDISENLHFYENYGMEKWYFRYPATILFTLLFSKIRLSKLEKIIYGVE